MEIVDQETKNKIINKVAKHLNVVSYYDIHELTDEEISEKYGGYLGDVHQNFLEIRFYPETNGLIQIKKLLSQIDEYFILPVDGNRKIYRDKVDIIDQLFDDHAKAHVIVVDTRFTWILIKNEFNKLIGIGDPIKSKIQKKVHMAFNNERIMYLLTDSKQERQEGTI